ncbi:hypothetical protein JOM56_014177 [Amanita muscaria]
MILRVQDASQIHLEGLSIRNSMVDVDVRTILKAFPSLRRLELPTTVKLTEEAMLEVGAGSIGVFLEDLSISSSGLDLEQLLQMIKARSSRAVDRDGGIEVTGFKSVTIDYNKEEGEMEDEVLHFIEEIKMSGVDLNVIYPVFVDSDQYSYDGNSDELEELL